MVICILFVKNFIRAKWRPCFVHMLNKEMPQRVRIQKKVNRLIFRNYMRNWNQWQLIIRNVFFIYFSATKSSSSGSGLFGHVTWWKLDLFRWSSFGSQNHLWRSGTTKLVRFEGGKKYTQSMKMSNGHKKNRNLELIISVSDKREIKQRAIKIHKG